MHALIVAQVVIGYPWLKGRPLWFDSPPFILSHYNLSIEKDCFPVMLFLI